LKKSSIFKKARNRSYYKQLSIEGKLKLAGRSQRFSQNRLKYSAIKKVPRDKTDEKIKE